MARMFCAASRDTVITWWTLGGVGRWVVSTGVWKILSREQKSSGRVTKIIICEQSVSSELVDVLLGTDT